MTRLTSEMLLTTEKEARLYADRVKRLTGMEVGELAAEAASIASSRERSESQNPHSLPSLADISCAAVPVTAGQGEISGFDLSVSALIRQLGATILPIKGTDVNGLFEAISSGADIVFMADDDRFIALNVKNGICCENDIATAAGYAVALDAMRQTPSAIEGNEVAKESIEATRRTPSAIARKEVTKESIEATRRTPSAIARKEVAEESIESTRRTPSAIARNEMAEQDEAFAGECESKKTAVLGYGRVGSHAATILKALGFNVSVYDKDEATLRRAQSNGYPTLASASEIAGFPLVFDATNEGDWLPSECVAENAIIAAPGIPLSFAFDAARERPDIKLFHDTLYTGTAVMLFAACG